MITRADLFGDYAPRCEAINSCKSFPVIKSYESEQHNIAVSGPPMGFCIKSTNEIRKNHVAEFSFNNDGSDILLLRGVPANGDFIFCINDDDEIRLYPLLMSENNMYHSYLAGFEDVKYAGEMILKQGRIQCKEDEMTKGLSLESGHYCIPRKMNYLLFEKMKKFIDIEQSNDEGYHSRADVESMIDQYIHQQKMHVTKELYSRVKEDDEDAHLLEGLYLLKTVSL